ncbi:MAG: peptidyl-prolyl cis-trans isomerase [Elusimicrobia bacterium CG_4_9_14_3_um_filter_62_55]|nr:MAG: peptidyl-prolyl cis-trans isomerase [Elusimicrobia bacterium CG22_combo_CG10-13_8_21_14_all_63_91]PJA11523.1 MAG: peptidyl-prolyl cis-trans isomerase [Elusimicrobia bacterium CG_4_10_14_0_2_um_filter_63_34]PJB24358.1 MAG: peptidyl-prolyl cis-trans isomerase [Elusimicrobia bacterium CG_4_9_14_3_um_filter_62_55]
MLLPLLTLLAAPLKAAGWDTTAGLYAIFNTGKGDIICRLFEKESPVTVDNFTGLALGTKEYTDPRDGKKKTGRYYDGTVFHRVIAGFMIQGGDPLGQGTGGPGYTFEDETSNGLKFDRDGLLAMANAGPNTNGSQFFITENSTGRLPRHLDGKHTIFGEVVEGQNVVVAIANAERVPLTTLRIVRVAGNAKSPMKKK